MEKDRNKLIEEALKVDDSEMYESIDVITLAEIDFANDLYDFISGLYSDETDLKESFKNRDKLYDHYRCHCLGKNKDKTSKRASVYYDFKDISLYSESEKLLRKEIYSDKTLSIDSLYNTSEVIKAFHKLFEGSKTLIFSISCGFISNFSEPVNILFHSYANEVTKNYNQNTLDFMMYNRFTKAIFPIDANYLENKFNNLIIKWNVKYSEPIKINR